VCLISSYTTHSTFGHYSRQFCSIYAVYSDSPPCHGPPTLALLRVFTGFFKSTLVLESTLAVHLVLMAEHELTAVKLPDD